MLTIEHATGTCSPAELERQIGAWAARLRGQARVSAPGVSSVDTIALVLAAARTGTAVALLDPRLTPAETATRVAALSANAGPDPAGRDEADPVHLILFTSGTTGAPKGAQLTRGQLRASARAANEVLGIDARARLLCCLPLFHVGGLSMALRCAEVGATLVLHDRFDAARTARALEAGATHVSLVASTLQRTLEHLRAPLAHVRAAVIGGGPVPLPLLDRARAAGVPVLQTYGMTETCAMATCERPGDADGATAGPAMPGMDLRIEGGEIEVRGPAVMRGYLGQPEVRGWFRTGDLGSLDARGRLTVHARRVDLILSGGENVYPAEIEAALLLHPAVVEAAVVPMADERWGQVGCAFVALRGDDPHDALLAGGLAQFLRERLAGFKIPSRFLRVEALPRTPAGKVDRRALLRSPGP